MTRLLRFFEASTRERSVFVWSFIWVVLFRLGLWILPFRVTRKWTVDHVSPALPKGDARLAAEVVRGVRFASRCVPYASCLTQALAARKLLESYGQSSELKIGVAKTSGDFEAHAWLEINGRIVLGKPETRSRYVVLGSSESAFR